MRLRSRLLLAFLIPTLAVLCLGGVGLYRFAQAILEEELGRSLSAVAATISSQLKAERVLALDPDDAQGEGSRTWRSLQAQLLEVKERTGLRRIVVVDTKLKARLDVGGGLTPLMEATELLRDTLEIKTVLEGKRAASQVLFEGHDGVLYKTGFAPLWADGEVVGLVAVEGPASFFGPLAQLRKAIVALALATLFLLAVTAVLSAKGVAKPMERLVSAALRIGSGDLSTSVPTERTREIGLLAQELEAMRIALESRDRQLKLMLGGVAHEVKNPLGGMELFSGILDEELATETPDVAQARSHLAKIQRELKYLKRIVDDFLVFAREQKLQLAPLNAAAVLEATVQVLAAEAKEKRVDLTLEAEPATLMGDESLLTGALVNLVKNAVQASASSQRVAVRGARHGGVYVIDVEDQGPGIPDELQARIFEPFFTTKEQGSGLGLPLAKKLMEAHGGTLKLHTGPELTRFTAELPCPREPSV